MSLQQLSSSLLDGTAVCQISTQPGSLGELVQLLEVVHVNGHHDHLLLLKLLLSRGGRLGGCRTTVVVANL